MSPSRRPPITTAVLAGLKGDALSFVSDVYELSDAQTAALASTNVVWKRGRRRRMAYYRPAHRRSGRPRYISIAIPPGFESRWVTYDRVHARLTTPPGGVVVPVRLRLVLCLVHEYTHAIQDGVCGGKKRRFLEAEPTMNEIEYARRHAPNVFAQLAPVQRPKMPKRPPTTSTTRTHSRSVSRSLGYVVRRLRGQR